jgi:hypothetical protein
MVQALSCWSYVAVGGVGVGWVGSQAKECEIYGKQNGNVTVFSPEYLGITLALSFHPCTILVLFYVLLLPRGKTGEAVEPSKIRATLLRKSGSIGSKSTGTLIFCEQPATRREDRIRSQARQCAICDWQWGRLVSQHLVSRVGVILPSDSHSSSSTCWPYQQDNNSALSEIGKHL